MLAGCASEPSLRRVVTVSPEVRSEVVYSQPARDFRQSLVCDPSTDPSDFYSSFGGDSLAKLVTVEQLQVLVDGLAAQGLFEAAHRTALPDAAAAIHVDIGGERWIWSKRPGMTADELTRYTASVVTFQNIFNRVESFHASPGRDAIDERRRLQERNDSLRGERDDRRRR